MLGHIAQIKILVAAKQMPAAIKAERVMRMEHYWVWLTVGIAAIACIAIGILVRSISNEKKRRSAVEAELTQTVAQHEQTVLELGDTIQNLQTDLFLEQKENQSRKMLLSSIDACSKKQHGRVRIYAFEKESGKCVLSDPAEDGIAALITGMGQISLRDALEDIRQEVVHIPMEGRRFSVTYSENETAEVYTLTDVTDSRLLPVVVKERDRLADEMERCDVLTESMRFDAFVKAQVQAYEAAPREDLWILYLETVPTLLPDEIVGGYAEAYTKKCAQMLMQKMGKSRVARYTSDSFCCILWAENAAAAMRVAQARAEEIEQMRRELWEMDDRLLRPNVWELAHYEGGDFSQLVYSMSIRASVDDQRGKIGVQMFDAADVEKILGYKAAIENAIETKQLRFLYQPIATANSAKIFAYEMIPFFPTLPFSSVEEMLRRARLFGLTNRLEVLLFESCLRLYDKAVNNLKMLPGTRILLQAFPGSCIMTEEETAIHEQNYDLLRNLIVEFNEELPDYQMIAAIKKDNVEHWDAWSATRLDENEGHNSLKLGCYMPELVRISVELITDDEQNAATLALIESVHADGRAVLADNITTAAQVDAAILAGVDYLQGDYVSKATEEPGEVSDKCMNRVALLQFGKRGRS